MTPPQKPALFISDKELVKDAMKEAIKEWLDDQFAMFGKWSMVGLCSMGLAAVVYVFLTSQGWHK